VAKTKAATAIDNGINSNDRGHRQHSTKRGSRVTVAVVTAMETAAVGTATSATVMPITALGAGAEGIAIATAAGTATTAACAATSAANAARTVWHFGRGVAHIGQYLPPLLKEVHAPHSQMEAEQEEAMMGELWVLVVIVVWEVVRAGCVCAASPCCFVRLTRISAPKNWPTTEYRRLPESS
jgi:hypothetical protein